MSQMLERRQTTKTRDLQTVKVWEMISVAEASGIPGAFVV